MAPHGTVECEGVAFPFECEGKLVITDLAHDESGAILKMVSDGDCAGTIQAAIGIVTGGIDKPFTITANSDMNGAVVHDDKKVRSFMRGFARKSDIQFSR